MYTYKTWQDKDNEIFSEPLHADASQCSQLNRQMMGGSQQTRPTKYNLLSRSVIHLLHSDQFVLINPHKGGLCETKAPGDNERAPPHHHHHPWNPPSASIHVASPQVLPFPAHCGPCLPPRFQPSWNRAKQARHTWKRGQRRKFPISASRVKYLRKGRGGRGRTMRRLLLYSGHSINQLWNKSWRGIQRATAEKGKKGLQ